MEISKHNYESFLLDAIEGNLDRTTSQKLRAFLAVHPELQVNLEDLPVLIPQQEIFSGKNKLKKLDFSIPVSESNYEDFCIAHNEMLLSEEKSAELIAFCLKEPDRERILEWYKKTYLHPQIIEFNNKKALYKKTSKTIRMVPLISIAAGFAALLCLGYLYQHKNTGIIPLSKIEKPLVIYKPEKPGEISTKKIVRVKKTITRPIELPKDIKEPELEVSTSRNEENLAILPLGTIKQIETEKKPTIIVSETETIVNLENTPNENLIARVAKTWDEIKTKPQELSKLSRPKISMLNLLKTGAEGINTLTDANMKITQKRDSSGNIIALSVESRLFKFQHTTGN